MSTTSSTTKRRAALYLRVSLDQTGEGLAIDRYRAEAMRLARQRGWRVAGVFDDTLTASGRKRRPAFMAMLDAIARGEIDAVICQHLDRLARNARDRLALVELCNEHGVIIALVKGSDLDPTTASGRLTIGILGEVAEHEIAVKSERQKLAAAQRAAMGKPPLGTRLTGYTVDGKIVPAEAKLIRRIYKMFDAGESLRSIARTLTDEKIPTRNGTPWNPSTVRTILVNPRYAGRAKYQGKTIDNVKCKWEPLVSPDVFDVVQSRLTDPARVSNREGTDRKHLGSGLYLCAVCEQPVSGWSQGRYRCKARHVNRSRGPVDDWVRTVIAARLRRDDAADLLKPVAVDLKPMLAEIDRLRGRLAKTAADYDADLIDGYRYAAKTKSIKAQIDDVQRKMASAGTPTALADVLSTPDPAAAFLDAGLMSQRAIVDALCVVKLRTGTRHSRAFDSETVDITPR